MIISLIAAVAANNVIGVKGDLPWHLPVDLKFFSETTKGHFVIMGRKNFDSIPEKYRPLPGRPNIVVTRNKDFNATNVTVCASIEAGIEHAKNHHESEVFIIGGGDIYRQTIGIADKIYITHIDAHPEGDTYFPEFNKDEWTSELILEKGVDDVHNHAFTTFVYTRKS
jgi:dihydrofolate reductase